MTLERRYRDEEDDGGRGRGEEGGGGGNERVGRNGRRGQTKMEE